MERKCKYCDGEIEITRSKGATTCIRCRNRLKEGWGDAKMRADVNYIIREIPKLYQQSLDLVERIEALQEAMRADGIVIKVK